MEVASTIGRRAWSLAGALLTCAALGACAASGERGAAPVSAGPAVLDEGESALAAAFARHRGNAQLVMILSPT